jgi:hypothetical protein
MWFRTRPDLLESCRVLSIDIPFIVQFQQRGFALKHTSVSFDDCSGSAHQVQAMGGGFHTGPIVFTQLNT